MQLPGPQKKEQRSAEIEQCGRRELFELPHLSQVSHGTSEIEAAKDAFQGAWFFKIVSHQCQVPNQAAQVFISDNGPGNALSSSAACHLGRPDKSSCKSFRARAHANGCAFEIAVDKEVLKAKESCGKITADRVADPWLRDPCLIALRNSHNPHSC